jgi:uncharacterized delta-60 repeat protein
MKIVFTLSFLFLFIIVKAQDGLPDLSFGDNGKVVTDPQTPGVVNVERQKITVIAQNKIYQVFSFSVIAGAPSDFGIMRYTEDGEPDLSFGTNGVVITDMGGNDFATALTVLSDGSFIVSGYSLGGTSGSFAMAKYSSTGILDGGFGTGGKVLTAIGDQALSYGIQVQADGKIILAGFSRLAGVNRFTFARYEANGTLDTGFGTNGITTLNAGTGDSGAYSLALKSDGKIVATGYALDALGQYFFAVVQLTTSGIADVSFDTDGIQTTSIGGVDDAASAVLIQADGKILVGGQSLQGTDYDFALVRYNADGSLDNSFGTSGVALTDVNLGSDDFGTAMVLQSDNKILLTGYTNTGFGTFSDFAVVRYTTTGMADNSFGIANNGITVVDFNADEFSYSIALQGSYILLGGYKGASLALARLNNSNIILPVHLTKFAAQKELQSVLLQWTTTSEIHTDRFEIEKSMDGRNYNRIATVNAQGNNASGMDYHSKDLQPAMINFYRLKIIDQDGSFTYSKVLVVRFEERMTVQAFPNPVKNDLNVQFKVPAGKVDLALFDAAGRLVRNRQVTSNGNQLTVLVDMSGLTRGIYVLKVGVQSIKIIKE